MKYLKKFDNLYESKKEENKLKDALFDIVCKSFPYSYRRAGKKIKRSLIPNISNELLPYINRLIKLYEIAKEKSNNTKDIPFRKDKIITSEEHIERLRIAKIRSLVSSISIIIFWILMEIKFEEDFKNSNKEIIKYILQDMDNEEDEETMLDIIQNKWLHRTHPITTSIYFADSIPSVREFLNNL